MREFVHLHNHSQYSFGDAVSQIPLMVKRAKELGMKSLALTDHGYGHGLLQFYKECKTNDIKPILGVEAYFTTSSIHEKTPENKVSFHLILLAQNQVGYKNLIKLLSIAATQGFYYKPRLDFDALLKHNEGLICTSSCVQGPVSYYLYDSSKRLSSHSVAEQNLLRLKSIFGDRFFFEIQYHGIAPEEGFEKDMQSQVIVNGINLANKHNIPVLITNDCHYVNESQWDLRNIVICNEMGTKFNDSDRKMKDREGQYYLKTVDQMFSLFKGYDESYLLNSVKIADMIEEYDPGLLFGHRLPKFSENSNVIFLELLKKGFKKKYPDLDKNSLEFKRLQYEMNVISQQGFIDYFLIVRDFIEHATLNKIPIGPGRGSAAGSIVSYLLDITTICPIKNNLIFERFLNPSRVSLPDIDIDVCKENRHKVIEYITSKYGEDSVSQIITFSKQKGRSAVRTVGRVLDIPIETTSYVSSLIPPDAGEFSFSLEQILEKDEDAPQESVDALQEFISLNELNKDYINKAVQLEGTITHSGVHAAAMVIAPEPLSNILPVALSKDKSVISQFSMNEVEELGLLKMDLLGLDTLSVISNCLMMIQIDNPEGPLKDKKDINTLRDLQSAFPNLEDPNVYKKILSNGRSIGIFQCDSGGLRSLLSSIKCSSFSDICAAISLYRPGPLDSGIADSFIRRRRKEEAEQIWHEELRPYMADTHGLAIYQEQIMFASQVLCGFDLSEADKLRKIIGKKKKEDILAFREKFVSSAEKLGKISKKKADDIYSEIEFFGKYCFNLSHAAAYSVITFYTAWLKTYYPEYYLCALLNKFCVSDSSNKKNDSSLMMSYLLEAQTMGVTINAPSISSGFMQFRTLPNKSISYGLSAIKGIGGKIDKLIDERIKRNGWPNLFYFLSDCLKVGMNKNNIYDLIETRSVNFGYDNDILKVMVDGEQRITKTGKKTNAKFGILDKVKLINKALEREPVNYKTSSEDKKKALLDERYFVYLDSIQKLLDEVASKAPPKEETIFKVSDPPIYIIL